MNTKSIELIILLLFFFFINVTSTYTIKDVCTNKKFDCPTYTSSPNNTGLDYKSSLTTEDPLLPLCQVKLEFEPFKSFY